MVVQLINGATDDNQENFFNPIIAFILPVILDNGDLFCKLKTGT